MIVMKFGGSSIKNAAMFKRVATIVKSAKHNPIVVLSAVQGITDSLKKILYEVKLTQEKEYEKIVNIHKKILKGLKLNEDLLDKELNELKRFLDNSREKNIDSRLIDHVYFFGERLSTKILAAYLNESSVKAKSFISGDIGMITNSDFGCARMILSSFKRLKKNISKIDVDVIPIVTGFGGKNKEGAYTTFDRGGSDYVASLIGAAVKAKEIQIWTDVNGIMSSNPKVVKNAKTISMLSFDEASELSYFGAEVLHPKTILPAIENNIPVKVLNTYDPANLGSIIVKHPIKSNIIKAISYKKGIIIIDIKSTRMLDSHGYMAKVFDIFEKYKKPIDMISTSEINVSMSVDSKKNLAKIVKELKDIAHVHVRDKRAIIYVVGDKIKHKLHMAGKIFNILAAKNIAIGTISRCFEASSMGFVVDENLAEKSVIALHNELIK